MGKNLVTLFKEKFENVVNLVDKNQLDSENSLRDLHVYYLESKFYAALEHYINASFSVEREDVVFVCEELRKSLNSMFQTSKIKEYSEEILGYLTHLETCKKGFDDWFKACC